ncbi:hypothetical protein GW17_00061589 [Ensete ventricosum]|nr:hypothetical protein GW17_00061589 [Ensete ventricosum]
MGSLTSTVSQKYVGVINIAQSRARIEFQSFLRASSQKFKILAIPNVFALAKSYEHGFVTKRDNHNVCAKSRVKSRFDHFLCNIP